MKIENIRLQFVGFAYQPSINYHLISNETGIYFISFTYLNNEKIKEEAKNKNCSWIVSQIYPIYPNINNIDKHPNYTKIYDSKTFIKDQIVNSLILEINNGEIFTLFAYDDVFVQIGINNEKLATEWLKKFYFEKVSMK